VRFLGVSGFFVVDALAQQKSGSSVPNGFHLFFDDKMPLRFFSNLIGILS
jgi:hypothetical protein